MSIALSPLIPASFADANRNLIEPFINACRLCMWKRDKMIHFGQRVDIISKINACLPTTVNETDELPKYICCECFYKLNMLYEFHKMCARTDFILRSYNFKSRIKVPEKVNANCVKAVRLCKQSCISKHDGQESSSNERWSEVVKTKEREIDLFCGNEQLSSNYKENETFLPRQQLNENKFNTYILDKQHTNIEYCSNREIEENAQSGNENVPDEIIDIVEDKIYPEGGNSEFLVNQGIVEDKIYPEGGDSEFLDNQGLKTHSHLSIESVYTVESENKENTSLIQPSQLSEMLEKHLDFNIDSKSLDEPGTSSNNSKPNSVDDTDRNSEGHNVSCQERKLENLMTMSPHSSSELNSIGEERVSFTRKTRHDEACPPVNHTDENVEMGTNNTDCPGYSSSSLQQQILQDSQDIIKTENEMSSINDSLKQNANNNLQPEILHSTISEAKSNESNWKTYLYGTKVLMPNMWKRCLKLQGQDCKLYQCNRCQKFLKNAYSLRRHMLVHTGVKPYKCPFCVRSFAFGFGFSVHLRTHTGERPYKCCECDKEFMDKPSLNIHMRKHTGIRPYKCNICHKQFYTNGSLNSHRKVHSPLYAFSCCECSKDFKRYYSLNLHMRLHTGFRPYKCPECDYTFIKHAHLKQHLSIHTGYKPFQCVKCTRSFSQYSNYRLHIRKHMNGIKVENNVCF